MRLGVDARATLGPRSGHVTGVVLAGGRGARFGGPKALLQYKGQTLLERTVRILLRLFESVVVVSDQPDIARGLREVEVIPDEIAGIGPMGGLHAALGHIATKHAFVVACDMPCLQPALIAAQVQAAHGADVVVPRHDGLLEPLHAVYGNGCLDALGRQISLGDYRLRSIFDQVRTTYLELQPTDPFRDIFTNLNTVADLLRTDARQ